MSVPELNPTKLGTKEHWDSVYEEELQNFEEIGDEGEVWFGLETVEKMVEWAFEHVPPSTQPMTMEVGTGNGTLLLGLLDAGYAATSLHGIDYSKGAVKLANEVANSRGGSHIKFSQCDFLNDDPPASETEGSDGLTECWDLLLDKGTYDAIALGAKDSNGHSPAIKYPGRVTRLLKKGGLFLITSCNFTEDELKASFITDESRLVYHSRIQHPVYTFGGKSGSICASVAFTKE